MKYTPNYQFTDNIHVDLIGMMQDSSMATLLMRIVDKNGISDQKHLFCEFDQLGSLLLHAGKPAEPILNALAQVLSKEKLEKEETVDIHDILNEPLNIENIRLRVYSPKMEISEGVWIDQDKDFLILDRIMPRSKQQTNSESVRIHLKRELNVFEKTVLLHRKLRLSKAEKFKLKECQVLLKSSLFKIARLSKNYLHLTEGETNKSLR